MRETRGLGSLEAHLFLVGHGLGMLGFGDASAALINHGKRGVAEGVVRLDLDDPPRVQDGLFTLCQIGVELGQHAVTNSKTGLELDRFLELGNAPGLSPWSRRATA